MEMFMLKVAYEVSSTKDGRDSLHLDWRRLFDAFRVEAFEDGPRKFHCLERGQGRWRQLAFHQNGIFASN